MIRLAPALLVVALLTGCASASGTAAAGSGPQTLRISGSTTVNPVAADAAEALRTDDLRITVDTQGGSAGGLAQLGAGQIDIAMSSKPVAPEDEQRFPDVDFTVTEIGKDAVGIVVRREVADGGLTDISKADLRRLFEGEVYNWEEIGGPDLPTFVYDKEPGRGTREVLDTFLYASGEKAPAPPADNPRYAIVGGNEETRTKLLSTPGSVAPLSTAFVQGQADLAILTVDGIEPSTANIAASTYPLSRPLYFVTDGAPEGAAKTFLDFVTGPEGQPLLTEHGYLTLAQLKA